MDLTEKTVNKKYIYNGKILNLRVDDILLPDGKPAKREIIEHSGGSAVYCEKDGKVLFVRQFRYPYKKVIYEIPAGKINAGEKPEAAAIRELEEECGVKAEKVTESLKSENQMEWVARMNSIQNRAEDTILEELIYN